MARISGVTSRLTCIMGTYHRGTQWWSLIHGGVVEGIKWKLVHHHRLIVDRHMIYIDDLVQDCSNSIANTLELLQCCAKPLICLLAKHSFHIPLTETSKVNQWEKLFPGICEELFPGIFLSLVTGDLIPYGSDASLMPLKVLFPRLAVIEFHMVTMVTGFMLESTEDSLYSLLSFFSKLIDPLDIGCSFKNAIFNLVLNWLVS